MKSPWRFLSDLIAGRKVEDGVPSPNDDAERPTSDAQASPDPERPPSLSDAAPKDIVQAPVTPSDEATDAPADAAPSPADERGSETASNQGGRDRPAKARRSRDENLPSSGVVRRKRPAQQTPPEEKAQARATVPVPVPLDQPPVSFDAEVMETDAEITALRRRLADTLKLQNAQLRAMLDRFGAQ